MHAALALLAGRFADAERLAQEALRLIPHAEDPLVFEGYLKQLGLACWEQDRVREIEDSVAGVLQHYPHAPAGHVLMPAWFHAEQGRVEEARAEIGHLSANELEGLLGYRSWLFIVAMFADTCAVLGDAAHAATLYALLEPYASYLVFESSGPTCRGYVSLVLGQLAHTMGRWDDALRHLDEALAVHERIGSPPWIANTEWAIAVARLARDSPGDRERAAALLDQVLETTEQLGMRRLQRKAFALRGQVHAAAEVEAELGAGRRRPEAGESGLRAVNATLRKEADYWVIGYKSPAFRLKDRIGLRYLAVLLRNPGRDFLAIDLVTTVRGGEEESALRDGAPRPALGTDEPYFDEQTRREYARQLRDLRATIEEAQAFNDSERASRAQAEMDLLADELGAGIGLRGRTRGVGSPVERARVSVTMAVKGALRVIAKSDPSLGRYFAASIKTGAFCCYTPDPGQPVAWDL